MKGRRCNSLNACKKYNDSSLLSFVKLFFLSLNCVFTINLILIFLRPI